MTVQPATTDRKRFFEDLVRDELPRLYGLARHLTGGRDAEDLVQESLARAYRSLGSLRTSEAGGRWLRAILVNAHRDGLRRGGRRVDEVAVDDVEGFSLFRTIADEDPFPYSDTLHLDFLGSFGREDVHEVLRRISEIYRTPLVLRYMYGFTTNEIASMLRVPLGTILARMHRGRERFERELWSYAEETDLLKEPLS